MIRTPTMPAGRRSTVLNRIASPLALLLTLVGEARSIERNAAIPISPPGVWLAASLEHLDVQDYWLRSHDHVAWRTGIRLLEEHGKRLTPLAKDETHCSSFAAAAADSLGIYLLHPPEHSHVLLANAQYDWLPSSEGRKAGWRLVKTALEAQQLANGGELVMAVFRNPDAKAAGHIAIVRPAAVTPTRIEAEGPQIMQAGFTNYKSTPLSKGFDHHPGAWLPDGKGPVRFYAHPIDLRALAGDAAIESTASGCCGR